MSIRAGGPWYNFVFELSHVVYNMQPIRVVAYDNVCDALKRSIENCIMNRTLLRLRNYDRALLCELLRRKLDIALAALGIYDTILMQHVVDDMTFDGLIVSLLSESRYNTDEIRKLLYSLYAILYHMYSLEHNMNYDIEYDTISYG